MISTLAKSSLAVFLALLLPLAVSAAPQNSTVDDHDFDRLYYWTDERWSHDPLQGYEAFFVNGTRSFTYIPGASAILNFTGTGIYLQGPHSNDQALRQISLDGEDMGTFAAYGVERLPSESTSRVFWGRGGLENTAHTIAVTHADTPDKIFVMDAWIIESDSDSSQSQGTSAAGAGPSAPSSTSTDAQSTGVPSMPMNSNIGIIIGVVVSLLAALLCIVGFCLFRRRRRRDQQRQREANKEKMFPPRLSGPVYPQSATPGETPPHWRSVTGTSAPEYSSSESNAELATAYAASGAALPSHPFHHGGRSASDSYAPHEDALGLSNHPLFVPSIRTNSSESHYPTPPPYAGAPMLFFEQRPDPPTNTDYTQQPIVNVPTSPSVLRRLSASIAAVLPIRTASRNSVIQERRISTLNEFRYNTTTAAAANTNSLHLDMERITTPRSRDSYFPAPTYLPSLSPNSLSIPLSPISAVSAGFARQSTNLEKLGELKYDGGSNFSTVDTSTLGGTTAPSSVKGGEIGAGNRTDPFGDEYAFSSYTRLTREEVINSRPVSGISVNNPR